MVPQPGAPQQPGVPEGNSTAGSVTGAPQPTGAPTTAPGVGAPQHHTVDDALKQANRPTREEMLAQMAERLELTGWVKNAENGEVIAEVQGFESRIRFLLKFMNSLKRIKIRKMDNKPHSIREDETTFKIL